MTRITFAALALAGIAAAAPAAAQRYNLADFDNPVFTYGYGFTGATFTAVTGRSTGCFDATITCTSGGFPVVGINTGSDTASFQTVDLPVNTLFFHPDPNAAGTGDAIVAFTAPVAGTYRVEGRFSRLDRVPTGGNGVNVIFGTNGARFSSTAIPIGLQGSGFTVGRAFTLAAGQQLYIGVNNNTEYSYDSTGLSGTIAAIPEPATWGMMILGFGMAGLGIRRRRRETVRVAFG